MISWRVAFVAAIGASLASAPLNAAETGSWHFEHKADAFTDEPVDALSGIGRGRVLGLQVRCFAGNELVIGLTAMSGRVIASSSGNAVDVMMRSDDRPAVTLSAAGRLRAVTLDRRVHADFAAALSEIGATRTALRIRVYAFGGEAIEDVFSPSGIADHLPKVLAACRAR